MTGEEFGLLLFKGGTVCRPGYGQYPHTSDAFCRQLGFNSALEWDRGEKFDIQNNFTAHLTAVECKNSDWESCTYSEDPGRWCGNHNDVFLKCSFGEYISSRGAGGSARSLLTYEFFCFV